MFERVRQRLGHAMVDRTTRHTSPDRTRTDGSYAVHARSVDVCLDNDGPFIDVEIGCLNLEIWKSAICNLFEILDYRFQIPPYGHHVPRLLP